jgi:hypothetical protein
LSVVLGIVPPMIEASFPEEARTMAGKNIFLLDESRNAQGLSSPDDR